MWIAGKRQRVRRDGKYVWVEIGQPVPEADTWSNKDAWERDGTIRWLNHPEDPEPKKPPVEVKVNAVGKIQTRPTLKQGKKKASKKKASKKPVKKDDK